MNSGNRPLVERFEKRPPPPASKAPAAWPSLAQLRERARALRRAYHLDELGAVAELVLAARRGRDAKHVVIAQRPAVLPTTEKLGEARYRRGEARILRRRREAFVFERA